jgi:CDP-diacylglycerol--serine O-phosphatidyltransferase
MFNLANILTALNLLSGSLAVFCIFFFPEYVIYLIGFSLIMDFLDGLVARALKIQSNIGRDLDSLADMVSFGLVPSLMICSIIVQVRSINLYTYRTLESIWPILPAFLIVIFAAFRLAKFNNDVRDKSVFYGLNTPTCTIFVTGLYYSFNNELLRIDPYTYYVILLIIGSLCMLLVSNIKMFSSKALSLKKYSLIVTSIIVILSGISIYLFQHLGLSIAILLYILFSIFYYYFFNKNQHKNEISS